MKLSKFDYQYFINQPFLACIFFCFMDIVITLIFFRAKLYGVEEALEYVRFRILCSYILSALMFIISLIFCIKISLYYLVFCILLVFYVLYKHMVDFKGVDSDCFVDEVVGNFDFGSKSDLSHFFDCYDGVKF